MLLPARGNTGPGPWEEKGWREFLALIGENMNNKEKTLMTKFGRHKETLESEGYTKKPHDTVEFRTGHGTISFRATEIGVEAARKAKMKKGKGWETKSLNELLGNPFGFEK